MITTTNYNNNNDNNDNIIFIIVFTENANMCGHVKLNWVYRGLQGFLDIKKSQKPKFYFMDDKRKLMYPDLIDMSAPAHAFAIKNDVTTRENIHYQFEKRAANVLSQYRTNSGKRNWEKLDAKVLKFHTFEDQYMHVLFHSIHACSFCSCSLFPGHIQIFKNIHWSGGGKEQ